MARKSKRTSEVKKYAGKTEEEWRDWGGEFGKRLDKGGREFAEEMEDLGERLNKHFKSHREEWGERFGRRMERRSREWGKRWDNWWFGTFGFVAPLISSIIGIMLLAFGIVLLDFIYLYVRSSFILAVSDFIFTNLHWFFAASLLFGYSNYFSKMYNKTYWIVSPIIHSTGIVIVIWILIAVLNLINEYAMSNFIAVVSNFLYSNLLGIFFVLVILGYIWVIFRNFLQML